MAARLRSSDPRGAPAIEAVPPAVPSDAQLASMMELSANRNMRFMVFAVLMMVLCLASSCNAESNATIVDKEADLLNSINVYRMNINKTILTVNIGAQCLATHLVTYYKETDCTNATAQYKVPDTYTINGYDDSIQDCRIPPQNVQDAEILPVCVNDSLVSSAFPFYTTKRQLQYQAYINSSDYVSAGVGLAGKYFIVILGTQTVTGNLAQNALNGAYSSSVPMLSILMPFLVALVLLFNGLTGGVVS